jgi:putative spermidine/putrescine transport system substrate-binding protein
VSREADGTKRARVLRQGMHRRAFLRLATAAAGAAVFGCSVRDDNSPTPTPPAPTPNAEALVRTVEGYADPSRWAGRTIAVATWEGEYRDAQERAIFEPFQRLTGAKIDIERSDTVDLRQQVEDGDVDVDVSDVLTEDVLPLANLGILEELDYTIINVEGLFPELRMDHGIGSSFFSTVLAYLPEAWPDKQGPQGWADFWNVDAYPGTRGLHREAQTTLEFALLADGVARGDLYPLDVRRAFRSLDRIRPAMTLWWEQGAQPAQIMSSGDLDMVAAWNGRIERIRGEGATAEIQWNGGALSGDSWVIPKGTENLDIAMDFINFATRPEVCAAFAAIVPFGPVHVGAFDLLPTSIARQLPTFPANRDVQFAVNFDWWFNNREAVSAQFDEWFEEHP